MIHEPRTSKGRPVPEDQIDRLAHEAETGYDPAALSRPGGRKPIGSAAARVVPVRLDPEFDAAVKERAQPDNTTDGDVIRDALHAWLKSARRPVPSLLGVPSSRSGGRIMPSSLRHSPQSHSVSE